MNLLVGCELSVSFGFMRNQAPQGSKMGSYVDLPSGFDTHSHPFVRPGAGPAKPKKPKT